ncbi:MAG: arylsulfatase [bacterium]|nr:arylsulfatase [bacterium]
MATAAGLSASSSSAQAAPGAGARKPNVIIVMTDDQGYGDLGCLGNDVIQTPNLDALHGESVFLDNFHVNPTCAPTRAGLMTGRYSIRTGIWHTIMGRSLLRADEVTMADVFSANGYATAMFGKWHLGDNYPYRPEDRGFQHVLAHGGGGVGQMPDYWGNTYTDDTYFRNGKPVKCEGYCTDVWFDNAISYIKAHKDRPFFVYVPTNAPHGPFNVPDKYRELYENKDVPNAAFYGMVTNIDENMGRLVATLDEEGLADDTILIFLTDNGTSGGVQTDRQLFVNKGSNGGMRGRKGTPYDGGHRVPCFVRWPGGGLTGPRTIDRMTAHLDMLPTLIDLCQMKGPDGVNFDGRSVVPLLRGEADAWQDRTLCVDQQRIDQPEKWRNSVVMTERWRLLGQDRLYDMEADPGQATNVAEDHPETAEQLRAAYEAWWNDVSVRFDEYCPIVIGHDAENPTRLNAMDWHGPNVPWNQPHILEGKPWNGFWAVDVAQAGTYEFALRRWPAEADTAIRDAAPGGTALPITHARIRVGDLERSGVVEESAVDVVFTVPLEEGETQVQTWFTTDGEETRGAYYVYVTRTG